MTQMQIAQPAETYQRYFVPAMFVPSATLLLRHAALRPGERVLDVACGTGVVSRMAAPLVGDSGRITGLDIGAPMLEVARALPAPAGARIEYIEGDAMDMHLPNGTFHAVVSQHGLPFMPDRTAAVREMRRVLKRGGRAVVAVQAPLALHPVFEAMMASVARHVGQPVADVAVPFSMSDAEAYRRLFAEAGFSSVEIRTDKYECRFPDADNFARMAVGSAQATVPAFRQLSAPGRAAIFDSVCAEIDAVARAYRDGDAITVPSFVHIAYAIA